MRHQQFGLPGAAIFSPPILGEGLVGMATALPLEVADQLFPAGNGRNPERAPAQHISDHDPDWTCGAAVSLNGSLEHGQKVALLVERLRPWWQDPKAPEVYAFLLSCGAFDAETQRMIRSLQQDRGARLKELPAEIRPLAEALKEALRRMCAY